MQLSLSFPALQLANLAMAWQGYRGLPVNQLDTPNGKASDGSFIAELIKQNNPVFQWSLNKIKIYVRQTCSKVSIHLLPAQVITNHHLSIIKLSGSVCFALPANYQPAATWLVNRLMILVTSRMNACHINLIQTYKHNTRIA